MNTKANDKPLPDRDERGDAMHGIDASMCVEAGAGTGKTTVLVERIMHLLLRGKTTLDRIVAITFTEKAAGELKIRLREEIEKRLASSAADESEESGHLGEALASIENAQVSTIHSFAASLLRERPVEAGIDPGFEQLDETAAGLMFDEVWDEWLTGQLSGDCPAAESAIREGIRLSSSGRGVSVQSLAADLVENRDVVVDAEVARPPLTGPGIITQYRELVDELDELSGKCNSDEDKAVLQIQQAVRRVETLSEDRPTLAGMPKIRANHGAKKNWTDDDAPARVKEIFRRMNELKEWLGALAIADLVDWLREFVEHYRDEKRRNGVLDFTDLLVCARDLLRSNLTVRSYFQRRYDYVLVDEFQDTDPLQTEIAFFLAEDGCTAKSWEEVETKPGKLFIVGDPKQSIYRFRRADVEMYQAARNQLSHCGKAVEISTNFRCVPDIIDWVNGVFSQKMQGAHQADYVPLQAHREDVEARASVKLLKIEGSEETTTVGDLRNIEALAIAQMIRTAVEREQWPVFDKASGGCIPVRYRHVAILMPRRTDIQTYEEALQLCGVPHRVESGRGFYYRQEVSDLVAVLRAIENPDDEAVAAALRTPFFGLSDKELRDFRKEHISFNYLRLPAGNLPGIADAFGILKALHGSRNRDSLHAVVEKLLDLTRILVYYRLKPHGTRAVANLLKLVDLARVMSETGMTFRSFIAYIEKLQDEAAPEADSPTAEPTDDFVRILTMHKSKGLEFPVVVPANMLTQSNSSVNVLFDRGRGGIAVKSGDLKSYRADELIETEKERLAAEQKRLLYVAFTRARDHLVLPLTKTKRKCFADHILDVAEDFGAEVVHVDYEGLPDAGSLDRRAKTNALKPSSGDAAALARRSAWNESRAAVIDGAMTEHRILIATEQKNIPEAGIEASSEATREGDDGTGRRIGNVVHAVMERIPLSAENPPRQLVKAAAIEEGISVTEYGEDIVRLVENCLSSEPLRRAREAEWSLRETTFCVPTPNGFAEGKIDLLFEHDGELIVVDYKTDAVFGDQIDARQEVHRGQGLIYAAAVKEATGRTPDEVIFVYAKPGEIRTIKGDEAASEGAAMFRSRG